ncbi:MAG: phosphate ABC transporter permease subunit PstC, partial [Methyloprofundus sp.]|nr:phosphate ABC transporter permease subunit PstC [Methyloprofundus sp.]
ALGETMIVVMAAGLRPNLSWNALEDMTTVTVRIVDALVGDNEFNSPDTLSAFALGLVLFVVTLILNIISISLIRKFKEKYKVNTL